MFLAIIGAEAGAMALRCLARGGVFIAGGIVPRLLDRVTKTGVLRDAFINRTARERFQYLLRSMPLYVVTNTKVGIIGSRYAHDAGWLWLSHLTDTEHGLPGNFEHVLGQSCMMQLQHTILLPQVAAYVPQRKLQPCHA
jgi:hypothetical protein